MAKRWRLPQGDPGGAAQIAQDLRIHPLLAQILLNRGLRTPSEVRSFLYPSLKDLHSPSLLKDIEQGVARIRLALSRSEKILLYGDYDVDGITGTALLWLLLRHLEGEIIHYFPHRVREGYGIQEEVIRWAKREGVGLIVAIDQGISAWREVEVASGLGIDVIICDHHLPGDKIPAASAVLNPQQVDCPYPFKPLAAAGVVFKMCQALAEAAGAEGWMDRHLDLVALGTIADLVPLKGENRVFAQFGLAQLQNSQKRGIQALLETSGLSASSLKSGHIAFILAPRLNAAGRMREAELAFRLLTTESASEAARSARILEELNRDRQELERRMLEEAIGMVKARGDLPRGICLHSEHWHPGVIGILASRLVDAYHRPSIIISLNGDRGRGSARSIPEFPINQVLEDCAGLLEGFGGHSLAAGFTIHRENLAAFRGRFEEIVRSSLTDENYLPALFVDGEVSLEDLSLDLMREMKRLEPYGLGNPEPTLACKGLQVMKYPRRVGENGDHLKIKVRQKGKILEAIGFGMGEYYGDLENSAHPIDLAFCPTVNTYQGNPSLQLRIKDLQFTPSQI
jgi:single-stranded-DNA-specific exonuclease